MAGKGVVRGFCYSFQMHSYTLCAYGILVLTCNLIADAYTLGSIRTFKHLILSVLSEPGMCYYFSLLQYLSLFSQLVRAIINSGFMTLSHLHPFYNLPIIH